MSESDDDVTVEADGVSIRKTLNDHQFETLAVVFDIRSGRERAAGVRIADAIPGGVVVEDIGFHPEYGGEHWRTGDGEVVFDRTFDPGEQYTTVYGVRDFDGERGDLLTEPSVDVDAAAVGGGVESVDDIVSESDSDIVREVISGERDTLPSLEDEVATDEEAPASGGEPVEAEPGPVGADEDAEPVGPAADADGDTEPVETGADAEADAEAEPAEVDDEAGAAGAEADDEPGEDEEEPGVVDEPPEPVGDDLADALAEDEGSVEAPAEGEPTADEEPAGTVADAGGAGEPEGPDAGPAETDADLADGPEPETGADATSSDEAVAAADAAERDEEITVPVTGGIARVLAKELRAGNVSYEDRRLLREELLPEEGSTDARIKRLQAQVADLAAYTDALEQFLDEEGGAEAVIGDVEDRIDELADGREDVEASLETVEASVERVDDRVDEVAGDVDEIEGDLDEVSADVDEVTAAVDRLADDVESVRDDLAELDALDRRIGGLEGDVAAIHDELEGLAAFRDRLSSVFGTGGAAGGEGPDEQDDQ